MNYSTIFIVNITDSKTSLIKQVEKALIRTRYSVKYPISLELTGWRRNGDQLLPQYRTFRLPEGYEVNLNEI